MAGPAVRRVVWLKVTCPKCGSVRVQRDRVVLCITMDEQSYAFTCNRCGTVTETIMGPHVFKVMLNTIVFDCPPITELEVHEFAEALNASDAPLSELEDNA